MKRLFVLLSLVLFCGMVITGCSKNSNSNNNNNNIITSAFSMYANAGDSVFNSFTCIEDSTSSSYTFTGTYGTSSIVIQISAKGLADSTYALDSSLTGSFAKYYTSSSSYKISSTGTVNILTILERKSVTGTFSFTCTDGTVVNNGTFTAKVP